MFFEMVNSITMQSEGGHGDCVLSIKDRPVEFCKYADITLQFAPFQVNRKSLLTKLYSAIEYEALKSENYMETCKILNNIEAYIQNLSDDFPFEIECQKLTIGPIIKAIAPEIEDNGQSTTEKIFNYMELLRELDRDKLFIMVNMRSYFSDSDMENFIESVCLHDFKVLLLESTSFNKLKNTKRYTIDEDLCEF